MQALPMMVQTKMITRFMAPALLLTLLSLAAPLHAQGVGLAIEADPAVVDFGDAYEGEILKTMVTFTNTGTEPYPVQQVRTSCGCTVARLFGPEGEEIPNKPRTGIALINLEAGQAIEVEVEFTTAEQHGNVEKTVTLFHVEPGKPSVVVPVRARVTKALVVTPKLLNLHTVGKRETVTKTILIESQDIGEWEIESFTSAIEARAIPECMKFEVVESKLNKKTIKLTIDGTRPIGTLSAKVRVNLDHDRIAYTEFFVSGVVVSDVTFNSGDKTFPQTINFDKLDPGSKRTRTLTITNADPTTPYVLDHVELLSSKDEFFSYEVREVESGVKYEVDLTADAAINQAFFRGNLKLIADHPDVPQKVVPFHGWVNSKKD